MMWRRRGSQAALLLAVAVRCQDSGGGIFQSDVPPVGNRLVCFWSNQRVPHSVQPSHADRFAVSAWYHDAVVL